MIALLIKKMPLSQVDVLCLIYKHVLFLNILFTSLERIPRGLLCRNLTLPCKVKSISLYSMAGIAGLLAFLEWHLGRICPNADTPRSLQRFHQWLYITYFALSGLGYLMEAIGTTAFLGQKVFEKTPYLRSFHSFFSRQTGEQKNEKSFTTAIGPMLPGWKTSWKTQPNFLGVAVYP